MILVHLGRRIGKHVLITTFFFEVGTAVFLKHMVCVQHILFKGSKYVLNNYNAKEKLLDITQLLCLHLSNTLLYVMLMHAFVPK